MNHPSFNVLTEPWIPVVRPDGSAEHMGIRSCLEHAHELRAIRDPAPIVEFGLYRLLIAFVLDTLVLSDRRPRHPLDLKALMASRRFDMEMFDHYVLHCGDVFELFHPDRPFLQCRMETSKPKPLAGLFPATPSGTAANHWRHEHEDRFSATVDQAARLLTTIAPFMTSGGAGLSPSINGAPAIYALPIGNNLYETIVLNIPLRMQDSGDGVAAWRSPRMPGEERSQATTVESMTWRPRRIQLIPEVDSNNGHHVRSMKFEKGDSTRLALTWNDASLAYRFDEDKTTPVRMREGRSIWRDAGPLLLLNNRDHGQGGGKIAFRRPDVVDTAFFLMKSAPQLCVRVYGMRTDMKMKVFEWANATLIVPSELGHSTRLGSLVQHELDRAERVGFGMRVAVKSLYPRDGGGNKNALGTMADRCERLYWQCLESEFHPLMVAFSALGPDAPDDPDLIARTAEPWRSAIRLLAREQFESAADDMDTDSDALARQVRARAKLHRTLKKELS